MRLFKVHSQRFINADKIIDISVQGREGDFTVEIQTDTDAYVYRRGLKTQADAETVTAELANDLRKL